MKTKKPHKQVFVKVNAPVDCDISTVISALSDFSRLQTVESCQGEPAWICFLYGENWKELSDFVLGYFGVGLAKLLGDGANVSIKVTESGKIRGELLIRPPMVNATAKAIKQLARAYNGLRSAV